MLELYLQNCEKKLKLLLIDALYTTCMFTIVSLCGYTLFYYDLSFSCYSCSWFNFVCGVFPGLSLITVFIHRQSVDINVPFYICHACELNIPVSSASIHLTSTQHYFNVFVSTSSNKSQLVESGLNQELLVNPI